MTLIKALENQSHTDLYEFEARLLYRANSRTARAVDREILSQKKIVQNIFKST